MKRDEVLDLVKETICHDRNDTHGNPEMSFTDIAAMWSVYLNKTIRPADVAMMMVMLKVCRYKNGKPDLDHMVDIAGYAAIAAELVEADADNGFS